MDRNIEGDSLIIPARLNKGDTLGRSSAASLEQFHTLRKYVNHLVKSIGEEILKGDVKIKPYKKKKETPCNYCNYSAFCQFDTQFKDNSYRILNDKTDEEVWSLISSGETNE
jgi:ATP-dependent helicase/nuclease subunit B